METTVNTANEVQRWAREYVIDYIRESGYSEFMGTSPGSIMQIRNDLSQNGAGKVINIPLVSSLKSAGVTGNTALVGNEEAIGNFNCPISIDWLRHGIVVSKDQSYRTVIDLMEAGRELLRFWHAEKTRDDITRALLQVVTGQSATIDMQGASQAQLDAWLAANRTRLLFGNSIANTSSADFSTALGTLDTTNDLLTTTLVERARAAARLPSSTGLAGASLVSKIRPYKTEEGREMYVCFVGTAGFTAIKSDTAMQNVNRDARPREDGALKNPLFRDGDLLKDGVLYREVPEIDEVAQQMTDSTGALIFEGTGASSANVRPAFLVGAQAIGIAYGQRATPVVEKSDYGFRNGAGIEELRGIKKLVFRSPSGSGVGVQHGVINIFHAIA